MASIRPIESDSEAVCADCGMQWRPLYHTLSELIENAACPDCGSQSYHYEAVQPHDLDRDPEH